MIELTVNPKRKKRALDMYLMEKNRWLHGVPTLISNVLDQNIEKVTHISNNPDNINGKIKRGIVCEYSCVEDLMRDWIFFEKVGIVNIRMCPNVPRGQRPVNPGMIRINFMPIVDNLNGDDYEIICLRDDSEKMEKDFLNDIMGGKIS